MADEIYLSGALGTFFWGILLLLIGAKVVIHCSLAIASEMGWTDSFVGFTIIAIGTSFPEIVTSLIASFRGYGSICIGNIIGSNIFNILFIVGASAYVCPLSITDSLRLFAIPFFVILTTLLSFLLATRRSIDRFFGFILFTLYLLSFHYMVR
jgi:cation:H+ antiporter